MILVGWVSLWLGIVVRYSGARYGELLVSSGVSVGFGATVLICTLVGVILVVRLCTNLMIAFLVVV